MSQRSSVVLYGVPKEPNGPSSSGFCQKLETVFRAAGYKSYAHSSTFPFLAPRGKVPYIKYHPAPTPGNPQPHAITVADSHFIIRHLTTAEGGEFVDLDSNLTAVQKAGTRAWQAWTEEVLYPAVVHTRWARSANFAANARSLPGPEFLKPILGWYFRYRILNGLWAGGIGRYSSSEIDAMIQEWVDGLNAKLESSESGYFHGGSEPTVIDAVLCGFLANIIGQGEGNAEVYAMLLEKERIRSYTATLTRRWFPEYEGLLQMMQEK